MTNSDFSLATPEGVIAIRSRPALYIGPLDRPAIGTFLLQEACCLAFDFAATGCCDRITITLREDGSACVADNGPGLPVSTVKFDRSMAEVLFTELFACRDWKSVHGVGSAACRSGIVAMNALSEFCHVRTT